MEEYSIPEDPLFDEIDIVNQEYYKGIKSMVNCLICLNVIKDPVQCDKCQHYYCSNCVKNLSQCPLRCSENKYIPSLPCKQLLSELKIKCKCGKVIEYDFLKKHKQEECPNADFKKNYFELKKKYELLQKELENKNKKEIDTIKHAYFIKSQLHIHPIEAIRRFRNNWFCNECKKFFNSDIPSYHCTLCDFDACYNCAKNTLTKGEIIEEMENNY